MKTQMIETLGEDALTLPAQIEAGSRPTTD